MSHTKTNNEITWSHMKNSDTKNNNNNNNNGNHHPRIHTIIPTTTMSSSIPRPLTFLLFYATTTAALASGAAAFTSFGTRYNNGKDGMGMTPIRRYRRFATMLPSSTDTSQQFHPNTNNNNDNSSSSEEEEEEEAQFLAKTKQLCSLRNLPLTNIKNARDLSSVAGSPILPGRIVRTGRVSDASSFDRQLLFAAGDGDTTGGMGIKTLVDLRSPTELRDDETLERSLVYGDFTSCVWSERKGGSVAVLAKGESRIKPPKKSRGDENEDSNNNDDNDNDKDESGPNRTPPLVVAAADLAAVTTETDENALVIDQTQDPEHLEEMEDCCSPTPTSSKRKRCVTEYPPNTIHNDTTRQNRKERHFVSLMNEMKYVRGTLSKLRKRDIAKIIFKSPGAILSRRVRSNCKDVFLDEINAGGLPMLNELLLKYGAPGIKYVLELCADESRHPIAFYCTAGKDRTGVISAIVLSLCGVEDEDIVEDYSLSANVYAEMDDHKAMVGALSQRNLNPKTFLGAPPSVMKDTLQRVRENYGSVEGYCDWIGFGAEDQQRLIKALTT